MNNDTAIELLEDCLDVIVVLREYTNDLANHDSTRLAFFILYSVIICCGVFGNACIVVTVARNRNLHTVRNLFLVNLAVADIALLLICGTVTPIATFQKEWHFGEVLCRLVPFLQAGATWIASCSLTIIAIDRYILIVHPTLPPIQPRMAVMILILLWLGSSLLAAPLAVKQQIVEWQLDEGLPPFCGVFCWENWSNVTDRQIYSLSVLGSQFAFPLLIITFCYVCISFKLRKSAKALSRNKYQKKDSTGLIALACRKRQQNLDRWSRTNRLLVAMVVAFVVCWLPQVLFNTLRDFQLLPEDFGKQEYFLSVLLHWIAMTSTCCNPILYALLNREVRSAFFHGGSRNTPQSRSNLGQLPNINTRRATTQLQNINVRRATTSEAHDVAKDRLLVASTPMLRAHSVIGAPKQLAETAC